MFVRLLLNDFMLSRVKVAFLLLSNFFHDLRALLHRRLIVLFELPFLGQKGLLICHQHFVAIDLFAGPFGQRNDLFLRVKCSLL